MIALVVDATKPGVTGWAAVRSTRELIIKGLDEGQIQVFFDCEEPIWNLFEDCRMPLPLGATRVKVEIVELNGSSRVFVDLE